MRDRQQQGGIGEQMDAPPHLMREGLLHCHHRGDAHNPQQDHREHGEQEVLAGEQRHELRDGGATVGQPVAHHQQATVQEDPADGPLAHGLVQGQCTVVPDGAVEDGNARRQQEHQHHGIGGDQSGDDAQRGDALGRSGKAGEPPVGQEECHRDGEAGGPGGQQQVAAQRTAPTLAAIVPCQLELGERGAGLGMPGVGGVGRGIAGRRWGDAVRCRGAHKATLRPDPVRKLCD